MGFQQASHTDRIEHVEERTANAYTRHIMCVRTKKSEYANTPKTYFGTDKANT